MATLTALTGAAPSLPARRTSMMTHIRWTGLRPVVPDPDRATPSSSPAGDRSFRHSDRSSGKRDFHPPGSPARDSPFVPSQTPFIGPK